MIYTLHASLSGCGQCGRPSSNLALMHTHRMASETNHNHMYRVHATHDRPVVMFFFVNTRTQTLTNREPNRTHSNRMCIGRDELSTSVPFFVNFCHAFNDRLFFPSTSDRSLVRSVAGADVMLHYTLPDWHRTSSPIVGMCIIYCMHTYTPGSLVCVGFHRYLTCASHLYQRAFGDTQFRNHRRNGGRHNTVHIHTHARTHTRTI